MNPTCCSYVLRGLRIPSIIQNTPTTYRTSQVRPPMRTNQKAMIDSGLLRRHKFWIVGLLTKHRFSQVSYNNHDGKWTCCQSREFTSTVLYIRNGKWVYWKVRLLTKAWVYYCPVFMEWGCCQRPFTQVLYYISKMESESTGKWSYWQKHGYTRVLHNTHGSGLLPKAQDTHQHHQQYV